MNSKKVVFFLALLILFFPLFSLGENNEEDFQTAIGDVETQLNWPTSPLTGVNFQQMEEEGRAPQLHHFIEYLYGWGIGIGGFFVFAMLVYGGIEYMTAAGNPGKTKEAMKRITSAATGLVLLLASFLILNTINPQLTQLTDVTEEVQEMKMRLQGLDPKDLGEPPCAFVAFFPEENYGGEPDIVEIGERNVSDIRSSLGGENIQSVKGFRYMNLDEAREYKRNRNEYEKVGEREIYIRGEDRTLNFEIKEFEGDRIIYTNTTDGDALGDWDLLIETDSSCRVTLYRDGDGIFGGDPATLCERQIGVVTSNVPSRSYLEDAVFGGQAFTLDCLIVENVGEGAPYYEEIYFWSECVHVPEFAVYDPDEIDRCPPGSEHVSSHQRCEDYLGEKRRDVMEKCGPYEYIFCCKGKPDEVTLPVEHDAEINVYSDQNKISPGETVEIKWELTDKDPSIAPDCVAFSSPTINEWDGDQGSNQTEGSKEITLQDEGTYSFGVRCWKDSIAERRDTTSVTVTEEEEAPDIDINVRIGWWDDMINEWVYGPVEDEISHTDVHDDTAGWEYFVKIEWESDGAEDCYGAAIISGQEIEGTSGTQTWSPLFFNEEVNDISITCEKNGFTETSGVKYYRWE